MRTGRVKEIAVVPFDVRIDGTRLGTFSLTVDHNEQRIANQNNAPTWLNWSSFVGNIKASDYTDRYLLLEQLAGGSFRLTISRSEPGPAVIPPAARV